LENVDVKLFLVIYLCVHEFQLINNCYLIFQEHGRLSIQKQFVLW